MSFPPKLISLVLSQSHNLSLSLCADKIADVDPATSLLASALAHAFALFVAVSVGANISGGHVNPAVTLGAFVCGHITLLRAMLYWIAQLLGSVVACILLRSATSGMVSVKKITLQRSITCSHSIN